MSKAITPDGVYKIVQVYSASVNTQNRPAVIT